MVGLFETHINPVHDSKRRKATVVERTVNWTDRIMDKFESSNASIDRGDVVGKGDGRGVKLWTPFDIECPDYFKRGRERDALMRMHRKLMGDSVDAGTIEGDETNLGGNVAIVGWERLDSNPEKRLEALTTLMAFLKQSKQKSLMILAVNDLRSIMDAARLGVTTIGTDLPQQLARKKCALVWDFSSPCHNDGHVLDLSDVRYARDTSPLQIGCTCLSCRPSGGKDDADDSSSSPRFTRAYIHHLVKAKEMLAETLLFAHNLHQLLELFRRMTTAAAKGEGEEDGGLDEFCCRVKKRL